jgi:hypothetical protein
MRRVLAVLACACAITWLAACSSESPATAGDYCHMVSQNLQQLNAPAIGDPATVDATSKLYRDISNAAPLAVKKEWQTMTSLVATAATVDPNNPASVRQVADMARQSQQAASTISDYTTRVCGVTIVTPTTTTIAPTTTSTTTP